MKGSKSFTYKVTYVWDQGPIKLILSTNDSFQGFATRSAALWWLMACVQCGEAFEENFSCLTVNICWQRTLFRWLGGVAVKGSNYETTKYPYSKKISLFSSTFWTRSLEVPTDMGFFEYLRADEHITPGHLGLQSCYCLAVESSDRLVAGQQGERDA